MVISGRGQNVLVECAFTSQLRNECGMFGKEVYAVLYGEGHGGFSRAFYYGVWK